MLVVGFFPRPQQKVLPCCWKTSQTQTKRKHEQPERQAEPMAGLPAPKHVSSLQVFSKPKTSQHHTACSTVSCPAICSTGMPALLLVCISLLHSASPSTRSSLVCSASPRVSVSLRPAAGSVVFEMPHEHLVSCSWTGSTSKDLSQTPPNLE